MSKDKDDRPLSSDELIKRARIEASGSNDDAARVRDRDARPVDALAATDDASIAGTPPETGLPDFDEEPVPGSDEPVPASTSDQGMPGQAPGPGEWRPTPRPEQPTRGVMSRFGGLARWIIAISVLLFSLSLCSGSGTSLDRLDVGECFADPGLEEQVSSVKTLDCNELHDFELYATVDLGPSARSFPGNEVLLQETESECLEEFPSYVGIDYIDSAYYFVAFTPVREGWEGQDDRTGMCIIYEVNPVSFQPIETIGTARNTGR